MKCQCKGHKCFNVRGCEERYYERMKRFLQEYTQTLERMIILQQIINKGGE